MNISDEERQERVITVAVYDSLSALVIIINVLPIVLTWLTELKSNVVNLLVASLSVVELCFGVFFVVGQTPYILWREELSQIGCRWLGVFHFMFAYLEFMLPPVLALNRYINFYYQHQYDRLFTRRNTMLILLCLWLLSAVVPIGFGLAGQAEFDLDNLHCCVVVKSPLWIMAYWLAIIVPLLGLCDGLMLFCNYKIFVRLRQRGRARMHVKVVRQNKEVLAFLLADTVLPACFYAVYHICKFVVVNRRNDHLRRLFIVLYLLHSCLRGLVTLTMLRPFRRAFLMVFCCRKRLGNVQNQRRSTSSTPVRTSGSSSGNREPLLTVL